jgi:hypothetical protein
MDDEKKRWPDWLRGPTFRSLVCFLAGLPLTILIMSIADPLLEPVRQSRSLRMVVFPAIMGWIILVSLLGLGITIRRQSEEIPRSPALKAGPASGCLMALNGIVLALAIISLILFFVIG